MGFFQGRVIPVTSKLELQWLPCQAPGVIGLVLGLVGPVSVYCDWVRWKVWSAISISVWHHVKLSDQIRPWDTRACCWDVKQPTNQQTNLCLGNNRVSDFTIAASCPYWFTLLFVRFFASFFSLCPVTCVFSWNLQSLRSPKQGSSSGSVLGPHSIQ